MADTSTIITEILNGDALREAGSRNLESRRASLGGWWTPNDARFSETTKERLAVGRREN